MKKILTDVDMRNNKILNVNNIYTKSQIDKMINDVEGGGSGDTKIKFYQSTEDFPTAGEENVLYITKQDGCSYMWDPYLTKYQQIFVEEDEEEEEVTVIQGIL